MGESNSRRIQEILLFLYGTETGEQTYQKLRKRLDRFHLPARQDIPRSDELFSEQDIVLITYGDLLQRQDEPPLVTLQKFITERLADVINVVHILPFYPYSSDDGFSVVDFTAVDPNLGTWEDIEHFQGDGFRLMFDAVINHVSSKSDWFTAFRSDDPVYRDYFITIDPSVDLSGVTRPRALPLLTPVETVNGTEHVWATFSADQIDLNFQNPATLLHIIDILLDYVTHGAKVIRLDAIAYLWKEIGTTCIHLPQTHAIIQLLRAAIEEVAPGVLLITETNVPHDENVSYFGDGSNEAHMVYNFSLPPLTAHAILTESTRTLSKWAASLETPSEQTVFFNFMASHDGIGVRPVADILNADELNVLLKQTVEAGGAVSSKTNSDGSISPYELNIAYFDLLNGNHSKDSQDVKVQRFLISQAIMLELAGIPGIYIHSLLGSRNYTKGVRATGQLRAINREKLAVQQVEQALDDGSSLRQAVFTGYRSLLEVRTRERAFHPTGSQMILDGGEHVFAVLRQSPNEAQHILALNNISYEQATVEVQIPGLLRDRHIWVDLLTKTEHKTSEGRLNVTLAPYQTIWAKAR